MHDAERGAVTQAIPRDCVPRKGVSVCERERGRGEGVGGGGGLGTTVVERIWHV